MTRQKDLKRLVRARMKKTGEAYSAARAQLLRKSKNKTASPSARVAASRPSSEEYARLAGMADATISAKSGRGWQQWVDLLDRDGAAALAHRDIARLVSEKYGVGDWWTQSVAVGYERIKGLRAIGQRRDGSYEANKSRTYNVPVTTLFDAWADAGTRKRWLDLAGIKVRTATSPKSIRLSWPDGTVVVVGFMPKGKGKSAVAVQHTKLPDSATASHMKQYWSERFDTLGELLGSR
jgi:uncharacterized protein YndB with AHSA1/START domain